jgi:hypothetical protein
VYQPKRSRPLSLRLSQKQFRMLDDYCYRHSVSVSEAMRTMIERALDEDISKDDARDRAVREEWAVKVRGVRAA